MARELEDSLGLSLSDEKTLITPVTSTMRFLGRHVRVRRHPTKGRLVPRAVIPRPVFLMRGPQFARTPLPSGHPLLQATLGR